MKIKQRQKCGRTVLATLVWFGVAYLFLFLFGGCTTSTGAFRINGARDFDDANNTQADFINPIFMNDDPGM